MKIPPGPPSSPLQDAILEILRESPETKISLAKKLNHAMPSIRRSISALIVSGKIRPTLIEDAVHYIVWEQDNSNKCDDFESSSLSQK